MLTEARWEQSREGPTQTARREWAGHRGGTTPFSADGSSRTYGESHATTPTSSLRREFRRSPPPPVPWEARLSAPPALPLSPVASAQTPNRSCYCLACLARWVNSEDSGPCWQWRSRGSAWSRRQGRRENESRRRRWRRREREASRSGREGGAGDGARAAVGWEGLGSRRNN